MHDECRHSSINLFKENGRACNADYSIHFWENWNIPTKTSSAIGLHLVENPEYARKYDDAKIFYSCLLYGNWVNVFCICNRVECLFCLYIFVLFLFLVILYF